MTERAAPKPDPRPSVEDLMHQFPHRRSGNGRTGGAGAVELAWYRGHQTGAHDAYKALRRKHPEAAALLLKHFGLDAKGNMT